MSVNIDINGIKNNIVAAYNVAYAKASEWLGRAIVVIKSGTEAALPYLQDKRIAAVSLIVTTLFLSEIADVVYRLLDNHFPNDTALKRRFRDLAGATIGIAIVGSGVTAFAKYTKIPFSPLAIFGISFTTVLVRAQFERADYN